MNTMFAYMYRDGANYKRTARTVLAGDLKPAAIVPYLDEGVYFIAGDVGLPDLQELWHRDGFRYPTSEDHPFSEVLEISPTAEEPDTELTATELLENFVKINGNWDVAAALVRLHLVC